MRSSRNKRLGDNLDNFRPIYPFHDGYGTNESAGVLYRSAKLNLNEQTVIEEVMEKGIQTVIDFGDSSLERGIIKTREPVNCNYFHKKRIKLPKKYAPDDDLKLKTIYDADSENSTTRTVYAITLLTNLSTIVKLYLQQPWYYWILAILLYLIDLLFRTKLRLSAKLLFHVENRNGEGLLQLYKDILDFGHSGICAALKVLSDENNLPAVVSCVAGKDRTGIVSALILRLLGQSNSYIARDYSLSEAGLSAMSDNSLHHRISRFLNLPDIYQAAKQDTMIKLLNYIDEKYGSVEDYLEDIGFPRQHQEQLKQAVQNYSNQNEKVK